MKITRRQLRKIIKEAMVQSYDLGREDSLAGIKPQLPDEDYMRGYNEAQMDAGLPTMQAPSDSGRGKKLDPNLLKGATVSSPEDRAGMADYIANLKSKKMRENHPDYGEYDADADAWYEERRLMDMDDRVRDVPQDMMDRVMNLRRGDLQDHMLDLVDGYEAQFEEESGITLAMLAKNLEDAERMDESKINERRMETDVFKIVTKALNQGPKTHQQLLANVLDMYPNTSDEEIDNQIDKLEDSGEIIFDRNTQKYR